MQEPSPSRRRAINGPEGVTWHLKRTGRANLGGGHLSLQSDCPPSHSRGPRGRPRELPEHPYEPLSEGI
jgi:hypothetical protein